MLFLFGSPFFFFNSRISQQPIELMKGIIKLLLHRPFCKYFIMFLFLGDDILILLFFCKFTVFFINIVVSLLIVV